MTDDDAKKQATAEGGSIYKAVKRLLDNNGLGRTELLAAIERVAVGTVKDWLKNWWGDRRLNDAVEREIRAAVKAAVVDEMQKALWSKRLTVTIEPKEG